MSLRDKIAQHKSPPQNWSVDPSILLCPRVPKPIHTLAPRVVLGRKWWDAEREAAYASTDQHCLACGVHRSNAKGKQWLEGHEVYEINYEKGTVKYVRTVPLCHYCHSFIHVGRLERLMSTGEITQALFVAVIQHGDRVLAGSGLTRALPYEGPVAPWHKWRLVIGRKRHPSPFRNLKHWCEHFNVSYEQVMEQDWFTA